MHFETQWPPRGAGPQKNWMSEGGQRDTGCRGHWVMLKPGVQWLPPAGPKLELERGQLRKRRWGEAPRPW